MARCASNRKSPTRSAKRCSLNITLQKGLGAEREAAWLRLRQEEMRLLRALERCAGRGRVVLGLRPARPGRQAHALEVWALAAVASETIGASSGSCCTMSFCSGFMWSVL